MPNWRVHLEIAKQLNKQINFNETDYNLFLLGNIAPDINNGYVVEEISNICNHSATHFFKEEGDCTYINFYNKYQNIIDTNPIAMGYFTHLYTDYLLNVAYDHKCEKNHLDKDECVKIKHQDLKKYDSKYIQNTINLEDYDTAIKKLNLIKEICINKQDLVNVIEFLNNKDVTNDMNLEFYTVEELDNEVKNITSSLITKYINKM